MQNALKILAAGVILFSISCSKVSPEVAFLSSEEKVGPQGPQFGRVTLGSEVHSNATYKLKSRVSTIQPAAGTEVGGYKLRGTVRY